MKVYVVIYWQWDETKFIGVYKSSKRAVIWIRDNIRESSKDGEFPRRFEDYEIIDADLL